MENYLACFFSIEPWHVLCEHWFQHILDKTSLEIVVFGGMKYKPVWPCHIKPAAYKFSDKIDKPKLQPVGLVFFPTSFSLRNELDFGRW